MNLRFALAGALLAATLAGCSTLHSQATPPAPTAATAPTPATAPQPATPESASASAAGSNGQLTGTALAEQQRKAAEEAAQQQASQQAAGERAALNQRVVHFDYDQSVIHPDDQTLLTAHAAYLSKHRSAHVRLAGHTDERGTAEYNMALGERRAKAVQAFLTLHGVQPGQLDVVSFGKEEPVDPGHTEEAWAKNRRVELHYQSDAP